MTDPFGPVGPQGAYSSPDAEVDTLLRSLGYDKVGGNGPTSVWLVPDKTNSDGEVISTKGMTQQELANSHLGAASPYFDRAKGTKPAQQAPKSPDRYEQNGVVYERQPDGEWLPARGIPAQAGAGGGITAGQSAQIGLGYAQLAAQNEREQAQLAAQMAKWDVEAKQVEENLKFLREKQAYAEKNDLRVDARETAAQIATQQYQQATLAENIRQAQVRSMETQQLREMEQQQFNATGQQRAAEFNATNQRETQRANMEFADRRDQRLQQVNRDIGVLGQDTGDRGQFAAYALANSGWGQDNAGIGQGTNFITNESVQPLEQSLQNRQALQNQNPNPYTFTPIAFNPLPGMVPGPLTQQGNNPNLAADQARGAAMAAAYNAANGGGGNLTLGSAEGSSIGAGGANNAPPPAFDLAALIAGNTSQLTNQGYTQQPPAMEDGGASVDQQVLEALAAVLGMEPKAIAGEKGKANGETVYSNGDVVVVPDKGKRGKGLKKMATGGLNLDPSFLSTGFLTEASKKARTGTPYADGRALPSPVYASSPGFDTDVAAFLDSIRALEQGVPVGYSQRLTAKYRPQGMQEQTIGRTA